MGNESNENPDVESAASIFPLPLTPLEKFFFWDDRPEQPCTFFIDLRFESSMDITVLEECFASGASESVAAGKCYRR